jgi:predicted  nucleic acid-binding Zn-ribbon protein
MAAPLSQLKQLIDRQAAISASIEAALMAALLLLWKNFNGWDDRDRVIANAAKSATLVDSALRQARVAQRSYYETYFMLTGEASIRKDVRNMPVIRREYPRENISALEVYQRPVREYGYVKAKLEREAEALKQEISAVEQDYVRANTEFRAAERRKAAEDKEFWAGIEADMAKYDAERAKLQAQKQELLDKLSDSPVSPEEIKAAASDKSIERLTKLVDEDLQMAKRDEAQKIAQSSNEIIGTRRVTHPERSESGVCGMCLVASTNWYTQLDMMPIHTFCKCETVPVTRAFDPGKTLSEAAVVDWYDDAGGNDIDVLSNTRYKVSEHDEKGYVLVESRKQGLPATTVSLRRSRQKTLTVRLDDEYRLLKSNRDSLKKRVQDGEVNLREPLAWVEERIVNVREEIQFTMDQQAETKLLVAELDKKAKKERERLNKFAWDNMSPETQKAMIALRGTYQNQ